MITEKINHWGKEIEIIKSSLFVDTMKLSRRQSELAKKEDRDCVVRAFMGALDISYDQAPEVNEIADPNAMVTKLVTLEPIHQKKVLIAELVQTKYW